jgi:hypothetical protein
VYPIHRFRCQVLAHEGHPQLTLCCTQEEEEEEIIMPDIEHQNARLDRTDTINTEKKANMYPGYSHVIQLATASITGTASDAHPFSTRVRGAGDEVVVYTI